VDASEKITRINDNGSTRFGADRRNIAVWITFPNEDPPKNSETGLTAEETKTSEVKGL